MLNLEIDENEIRKEFSFKERMEWARLLEEELGKKAKGNMLKEITLDKNLERIDTNKTVSSEVGFGNKETYRQAKYIYENADEEMIKQLDDGKLSINKAYNALKYKAKELESKAKQLEQEKQRLQAELQHEKSKPPKVETRLVFTRC